MQIDSLNLKNFRNYDSLSISFDPKMNIIYGENGQGKTNILESIYMSSFGKSHKGSHEREIIKTGCEEAHIRSEFSGEYGKSRVDIHLKKNKDKGIALNQIPLKKISELYGKISVVIFSAEDLDIIKRGPSDRRDFLDMEICQIDHIYMENLINYNKLLKQRRELFKKLEEEESNVDLTDTLDIWDLQLCRYGSLIIKRRKQFINEINKIIPQIYKNITSGNDNLQIIYEPSTEEKDMYEMLLKNRERDKILKQTSVGPHRDDFSFFEGKTNMKVYGSGGQQRTCALTLKLSEIDLIKDQKKEKPVLLLDDVLSELDRKRQERLFESLNDVQTLITCTGLDEFVEGEFKEASKFYIKNASVEQRYC